MTETNDWTVVEKKKKTGGRTQGTRNLSVAEKSRKSKAKGSVGRPSGLKAAADLNVVHPGGVKQRRLDFSSTAKIPTKFEEEDIVISPRRKLRSEKREGITSELVSNTVFFFYTLISAGCF
jgi:hypothetical protein